jgi:hypothetical protein
MYCRNVHTCHHVDKDITWLCTREAASGQVFAPAGLASMDGKGTARMIRSATARGSVALALLLSLAAVGRADLIHWTYSWSSSPNNLFADTPGSGYINLSSGAVNTAAGNSDIVAANLQVHSTSTTAHPDTFTNKAYTLTLSLTDHASSAGGTLAFSGTLSGTATAGSANITNTFTGIGVQSIQLGDNLYTVTIGHFTAPGPPDQTNSGSIGAHALVVIQHLPEPGSLLLGSVGLCLLVLVWLGRCFANGV